ncbi:SusC/RagA family TonB-linked outer membrane protein [Sphingobacterium sp. SYP-B4668]|uniref:SusC/RagA family TonB-linked outer membrane protein n=1 Tax=Sphingobacterium sp. SYP-B4668 TaxID=2996035 RepID=UPI0022DE527C|nr:SusC/RagA family TonB-linked outer membrane protein [Sphingobacterium sp. SYP-B4668]
MKQFYHTCCTIMLISIISISSVFAQQTVTGKVTDANGNVPGVTVSVKGTNRGTQTGTDGNYTIQASSGETLRYSIVGYAPQEIVVGTTKTINVTLMEDAGALEEVVVTAMGVKKEKRSLGYSFQEIKGEDLTAARENNIANALAGKVSNLQVIKGSNGPSSSSKIILRGFNSLNGDNQPLIVVDGVPMDNFVGASNNDFWNPSADMGSGLGDLNPEDIESMSVLKGGAASALYGSRASNGVILITTKTGKAKEGVGISYSTITGIENIFMTPELQSDFSQGAGGIYGRLATTSWGEKISGQEVDMWDGSKTKLQAYDNLNNFFKTGFNTTQNINFQQAVSDKTNLYTSATYLHDNSKTPGMKLNRLNLINRVTSKFGERNQWSTDVKVQYMKNMAYNRAVGGQNGGNYYAQALLFPRSLDLTQFKEGMDVLGTEQTWYLEDSGINPYWAAHNKLSNDTRDRYLMNATVKYDFNDWLSADARFGTDTYTTKYDSKTYTGSHINNSYSNGTDKFFENNYILSLHAKKDNLFGKWGGNASLYGQIMERDRNSLSASAGSLRVPNLFTLGNSIGNPGVSESISRKQINSLYANVELNYDNVWYVSVTGRNDWTSTLHPDNNSYFYPSISTSLVLSDLINKGDGHMPSWFNFAKIRASYAETGRDMDPYQLYNTYSIGNDPNNNTTASKRSTLYDAGVVNELLKSIELGFDTRFLDNRIGLDFTYYKNNSTNQLINIPMNNLSGYGGFRANAGNILNEGLELVLSADILRNPNGLRWNMNANISKNINKIIEFHKDVKQSKLGGIENVGVFAEEGKYYGAIYGSKFLRVEDEASPHFGKMILMNTGLPQKAVGIHHLGDQTAKALVGLTNSFGYKNFGLSFQIDGRFGGKFFSGTQRALQLSGSSKETVVNGAREKFVVDGVILKDGNYSKSEVAVNPEDYWNAVAGPDNLGITEQNLYNATNVRIRNAQISYSIPSKSLKSSMVKSAKFGLSVNNLAMLKSYGNGVDPESTFALSSNAVGFEYLSFPTSRSYFLNISLGF